MSHRTLESRHSIESCTFHLNTWRPFQLPITPKTLDSDSSKPYSTSNGIYGKRPCRSDRATSLSIDAVDMSRLSLFDDNRGNLRWIDRKRRRKGSRSVSGKSSDRSGTRRRCSTATAGAYGTCSDFPMAAGTDSSGELFLNGGDANWASDVSEVAATAGRNSRRERDGGGDHQRESFGSGFGQIGNFDNESGYGSEPGYRGDAEFGYGDEVEEEEDDPRLLFWGEKVGDNMEMVGENTLQKAHHRGRRKKQDLRMVIDPPS